MRIRIAILASILIGLSLYLPFTVALHLSRHLAISSQRARLISFDERMIRRADTAFGNAKNTLRTLAATPLTPCSDAHIAQMQLVVANNTYITGVGYIGDDGFLQCTSLGLTQRRIPHAPSPYEIPGGFGVIPRIIPQVTGNQPRIVLYLGRYDVLIDPGQFVDLPVDDGTQLVVSLDKVGSLAQLKEPDPDFVASLIARPRSGSDANHVYAAVHAGDWTAIAIQELRLTDPEYRRLRKALVPVGALFSAFLVAASIGFLRWAASLKAQLIEAVWRKELVVHYQPIIDIASGACVGAEALVRWPRRQGGFVSPDVFIPLAEQSTLIATLTDHVIATVVRDLAATFNAERSLHVSINLPASDVSSGRMLGVLDGTGVRPEQIWLEVTERGVIHIDDARAALARARERGYSIAIDDFGTGYSGLQHLASLPLDALKIDKSFVQTIGQVTTRSSVTPHIIEMAHTLKLACIAEGVETEPQLAYLAERGVQYAQGWLFSEPLPPEAFIAFFARRKAQYGTAPEKDR